MFYWNLLNRFIFKIVSYHFVTFNSNKYWGWGGEDDDMYQRIKWANYKISRPQPKLARFKMIKHLNEKKNAPNMNRFNLLKHVLDRMPSDGINRFVNSCKT